MSSTASYRNKFWLYTVLALVLLGCLWAGWRDFDLLLSQHELRESIRWNIRWAIQVLIQFLVPGAILLYFGVEALAKLRYNQRNSADAD